ncbi:MAG TPA: hypothetical protein VKZ53_14550 [Candidatus Angelobacter sp.]|nr:hypothetical protein [Candidatus Angelobacter sp.]
MRLHQNKFVVVLAAFAFICATAGRLWSQVEPSSLSDASGKGSLALFQDFAKYPPESRPLNSSNWDLLHPWLTESSPMPLVPSQFMRQLKSLSDAGLSEREISQTMSLPTSLPSYQFVMNKTILAGTRDEVVARLTVTPPEGSTVPVRIHVSKVELIGDSYFGSPSLGSVPFSCEAASPVCTFRWRAPSTDKKYWGALELNVTVAVEGIQDQFLARQSFFSSPMVAGRFNGSFQEKIENGSLIIDAGVHVEKHMACFVTANLFSTDKEVPTHFVQRRMILDPSMKTVPLTFFGKIFRDNGHAGVFRLQDLKAQCENLPYPAEWFMDSVAHQAELHALRENPPATREPARIYFEYNNLTYTTRKYASNDFSDQEWQAPEKTRKIEALKKAAAELSDPALEQRKKP